MQIDFPDVSLLLPENYVVVASYQDEAEASGEVKLYLLKESDSLTKYVSIFH